MKRRNGKVRYRTALAALSAALWLAAPAARAQYDDPTTVVAVEIPAEVPLKVVSKDFADSDIYARGGALIIELNGRIVLRNEDTRRVRGVTLAVYAQEQTLGGRAAVAVPSLNARAGESFPVRLSLRLLRPLPVPAGAVVRVTVDGLLFDTTAFVGPNRLDSRHKMTVREMEARRDREYFRELVANQGQDGLMSAMQTSLRREAERPRLSARIAGRSGAAIAGAGEPRQVVLAFVQSESSPLVLEGGSALVTGSYSDAPTVRVRNRASRPISSYELGWLIRDADGTLYSAGAVPAGAAPAASERRLAEGQQALTASSQRYAFRAARTSRDAVIDGMSVYVRHARFSDGRVWIPSRAELEAASLLGVIPVSVEEQRLAHLYREKGPTAVIEELRKFE